MSGIKNFLRSWLEVKEPIATKDWAEEFEVIKRTLEEFKGTLGKFVEVECAQCHKHFHTYPYGGGYYTSQNGRKFCSGICLDSFTRQEKN